MQLCNYEFIICHPSYHDAVPFPDIKSTSYQALKTRLRCLLGYNHPKFSLGGASSSTREKPLLVVQLTAWPWILSKLKRVAAYFKYDTITPAESERWRSTLRRLQEYLTASATKERESAALALTNIHCITQIGFSKTIDTVVQTHPCCLLLTNILTE